MMTCALTLYRDEAAPMHYIVCGYRRPLTISFYAV